MAGTYPPCHQQSTVIERNRGDEKILGMCNVHTNRMLSSDSTAPPQWRYVLPVVRKHLVNPAVSELET
jgi:hypothetical protein